MYDYFLPTSLMAWLTNLVLCCNGYTYAYEFFKGFSRFKFWRHSILGMKVHGAGDVDFPS